MMLALNVPFIARPLLGLLLILEGTGDSKTFAALKMSESPYASVTGERIGITFRHHNGSTGEKEMIETMGSGCALLDYDNDGKLDIYFISGASLPSLRKENPRYFNRLYRNLGDFIFADVTVAANVQGHGYGMGVAAADYDNDGFIDLYLTNFGRNQLFHNRGDGTFVDVTDKAGVGAAGWSTSAAFFDYDRDGYLDLFVCRYVEYELGKQTPCGDPRRGLRSYCLPDKFQATSCILFRNSRDGTFSDVSQAKGIGQIKGKGLGVVMVDVNQDGWMDIFVANDRTRNFLFLNNRGLHFAEVGTVSGVGYSVNGAARAGMGVDSGDFDQDGLPDILVTNFEAEGIALFRNEGSNFFQDESGKRGLLEASFPYVGFGAKFIDYENDGQLDIFAVNGHVLDDISSYQDHLTYPQPKLLFQNIGGYFSLVNESDGGALATKSVGRGAAFGDMDNDGDMDVVINNNGSPPEFLRNNLDNGNRSMLLKLRGTKSNRDGIGTRVEVRHGNKVQMLEAKGGASYLSHNDLRVHVGLGKANLIDELVLYWPSGKVQRIRKLVAGHLYSISESADVTSAKKLESRRSASHR